MTENRQFSSIFSIKCVFKPPFFASHFIILYEIFYLSVLQITSIYGAKMRSAVKRFRPKIVNCNHFLTKICIHASVILEYHRFERNSSFVDFWAKRMSCLYFISVACSTNNRFVVWYTIIINYGNSFRSIKDDVVVVFDESKKKWWKSTNFGLNLSFINQN